MVLNLYVVSDASNVINKTKSNIESLQITLKRDFDIQNPTLKLLIDDSINIKSFNYCEIPELNRSYFIDNINLIGNKLFELNLSCDVLETYKDEILNSNSLFKRKLRQGDYIETSLDSVVKKDLTIYKSDVTLTDEKTMIMTTVGVV